MTIAVAWDIKQEDKKNEVCNKGTALLMINLYLYLSLMKQRGRRVDVNQFMMILTSGSSVLESSWPTLRRRGRKNKCQRSMEICEYT